jgi:hypothetical protein
VFGGFQFYPGIISLSVVKKMRNICVGGLYPWYPTHVKMDWVWLNQMPGRTPTQPNARPGRARQAIPERLDLVHELFMLAQPWAVGTILNSRLTGFEAGGKLRKKLLWHPVP